MEYIAHRGNNDTDAENKLESILKTLQNPLINGVEIDLHLTKDYKLILSHNLFLKEGILDYTCICKYKVKELKKKNFMYQGKPFPIHTLNELLKRFPSHKKMIIECKTTLADHEIYAKALYKSLQKYKKVEVEICSFDYNFIKYFKQKYPNYSCGLLIGYTLNQQKNYSLFDFLSVHYKLIRSFYLERPCYAWTVNDIHVFKELDKENIKGIISDKFSSLLKK